MTPKKPRKSLDDSLATDFVFGNQHSSASQQSETTKPAEIKAESAAVASPIETPSPDATPKKSRIMDQLMEATEKEPTVRFTVDMAESMHRKLSILAARTGKKKVEIVRMLLHEALEDVEV